MNHITEPEAALIHALHELALDLFDARVSLEDVEGRLEVVFSASDLVRPVESRLAILDAFVHELIAEHALRDKLPMRVEIIAQLAWQIQCRVDPLRAVRMGLLLSDRLSSLNDDRASLVLIEQMDTVILELGDHVLWRSEQAMRMCRLMRLQRFAVAHQLAKEYEQENHRRANDAFELWVFAHGANAASMINDHASAKRRSSIAVERYLQGDGRRREDTFFDGIIPEVTAARVFCTLGEVLRKSPDPMGAIDAFQQGRWYAQKESDPLGAAWCLSEIGITWERVGEFARSKELLERAAQEAERHGDVRAASRWRGQRILKEDGLIDVGGINGLAVVGRALNAEEPTDEHERIVKAMIKEGRAHGTQLEPMARNMLAAIYAHQKRFQFALMAIAAAVASADKLKDSWLALGIRSNEAKILFEAGFWADAAKACDQVLTDAQAFWDDASTSEMRQVAISAASSAAEIALLISAIEAERDDGSTVPVNPEQVLQIVNRTRAKTFNRWLMLIDWSRQTGFADIMTTARDLITAEVVVEWAAHEGQPMRHLLAKREEADHALSAAVKRLGTTAVPAIEDDPTQRPNLPCATTALDLSAIESGIVCLHFGPEQVLRTRHIPWTRKARSAWRSRWYSAWEAEVDRLGIVYGDMRAAALSVEDSELAIDKAADSIDSLYSELDREFVTPLVQWMGCELGHLIVALHAELAFIPMWALARAAPGVALSIVPSLRSISLLVARPKATGTLSMVVGDATKSLSMVDRECELLTDHRRVAPNAGALANSVRLAGRVHFAGHGEFDNANPYVSGLVLNGERDPPYLVATGFKGCTRLTIPGILRYVDAKDCDLVTISACSVGKPRSHAASEFTSVPTALLLAGARNVVAASWHVHDASTVVLMGYFYEELRRTFGVARSLAQARQRLASTTRADAVRILGREDVLPEGKFPFSSPIFTDAVLHFGTS